MDSMTRRDSAAPTLRRIVTPQIDNAFERRLRTNERSSLQEPGSRSCRVLIALNEEGKREMARCRRITAAGSHFSWKSEQRSCTLGRQG